ncbi:hypothetical protein K6X12_06405 [Xanthomonas euvesicatoria pv. allii]|uniref:hypothetical protein n=1 Tax=Xanthomonas euvesicatoria TaxID=456327 RepID=UPI0024068151|nr:hypothetical protein [Xanthomonas euvesicatoria]MCP3050728.1 hypothetical protein [Xanthomonas euvesicatoria pv. allii]
MRATPMFLLAVLLVPAAAQAADDDTDPCKIALCLANPDGPTAVSECEPPIRYLKKRLAEGKSMPKCDMGGGGSAEKKGDQVVFKMDGQDTLYFNWKTGESYKVPGRTLTIPGRRPVSAGNSREQVR